MENKESYTKKNGSVNKNQETTPKDKPKTMKDLLKPREFEKNC